jgi:murein L,D-transpeptidase YafK
MFTADKTLPKIVDARLVIHKNERRLDLLDGDELVKTYKMVLGFSPSGDKRSEGDGRTPEGDYFVFTKNPESKFFLSLGLSYPGKEAAERGLKEGIITQKEHDEILAAIMEKRMPLQKTGLGGEIYVHGGGAASDWTQGCIALDDEQMMELFEVVPVGAKATILP